MSCIDFIYDPSEYQALAFTVKKLGSDFEGQPIDDYQRNVLHKWSKLAVMVQEPYFEEDSKGKIHMHGVLYARKNYYKKKLSVKGYYVYVTDIWDLDRWLEYCKKVKHTATIDNTVYLFDDEST